MLSALKEFLFPAIEKPLAYALYVKIVEQARQPALYLPPYSVPDTLDGRFEMIVLHFYLLDERLKHIAALPDGKGTVEGLRDQISTLFVDDMDRSLREMGATDTGVGKRVRRMGVALIGRGRAYFEAGNNSEKFRDALARNVYGTVKELDASQPEALGQYVQKVRIALAEIPEKSLFQADTALFPAF